MRAPLTQVPYPPVEPEPTGWALRPPSAESTKPGEDDLVAVGADLEPGTLVAAYRLGLFPMGLGAGGKGPMGWWAPDPRGVLEPGLLRVSRSLRRSVRHLTTTVDRAFEDVVAGCADRHRQGRWITRDIAGAYARLHGLGWAHSVEVWDDDGALVGGLYGVAIGGLFAGESMFHRRTDASKVALVTLADHWFDDGAPRLVDVQWRTPHLASLGVTAWPRRRYLGALPGLVAADPVRW